MFKARHALAATVLAFSLGPAQATYVVDTGTPTSALANLSLVSAGTLYQNYGISFNLAADTVVDSVESVFGGSIGSVSLAVHEGNDPNGAVLFSQLLTLTTTEVDWHGVFGMNLSLPAGDYTLTVSAQPGFNGVAYFDAPSPQPQEWVQNFFAPSWGPLGSIGLALRVDSATVPEPAGSALVLAALAGLRAARRRSR